MHRQLHKLKAKPTNLNELLRTDLRSTTLAGRNDELAMINAWLADTQKITIKCIIGEAGTGKTRLAIEACEAAEIDGWFATFVQGDQFEAPYRTTNESNFVRNQPLLVVIDDAAISGPGLKQWLSEIASQCKIINNKLRIILLERYAEDKNGWWADLKRPQSNDHASAVDLVGIEPPYVLPPLDTVQDRRALLSDVILKAAPLFDPVKSPVVLPQPGTDPWFDHRLSDNKLDNNPLFLTMAGIRAVETGVPTALAMNRLDLAAHMAAIEEARLEKFAKSRGFVDQGKLLKHIVACITLQNGCDPLKLPLLVAAERQALGISAHIDDEAISEALIDFLPLSGKVRA